MPTTFENARLRTASGKEISLPDSEEGLRRTLTELFMTGGTSRSADLQLGWEDMKQMILKPHETVLADAVSSTDILGTMQIAMTEVIRMPLEPMAVMSSLFTTIRQQGHITQIITGVLGAVYAEDVKEGEAYPEVMIQRADGMQTVTMGKSGLQASFTEEALRYSTWDLIALHIRAMRDALVRHKEEKAAAYMKSNGTVLYDNLSPSSSLFGILTGRDRDMASNGSLNVDDLFRAYAHMDEQGFAPDLLIVHPLHYMVGTKDPLMRQMLIQHGGGGWFQQWQGSFGNNTGWNDLGGRVSGRALEVVPGDNANSSTASGVSGREFDLTATAPVASPVFPFPLRIIASSHVPFDAQNMIGDMFLVRSNSVGLEIRDQDEELMEWTDQDTEVTKIRLKERYSLQVMFDGFGIGVIKNVPVAYNFSDVVQITKEASTSLTDLDPLTVPPGL